MVEVKGTLRVTRPDTAEEVWSPEHRERSELSEGRMGDAGSCASRTQCSQQSLGRRLAAKSCRRLREPPAVARVNLKQGQAARNLEVRPSSPGENGTRRGHRAGCHSPSI